MTVQLQEVVGCCRLSSATRCARRRGLFGEDPGEFSVEHGLRERGLDRPLSFSVEPVAVLGREEVAHPSAYRPPFQPGRAVARLPASGRISSGIP